MTVFVVWPALGFIIVLVPVGLGGIAFDLLFCIIVCYFFTTVAGGSGETVIFVPNPFFASPIPTEFVGGIGGIGTGGVLPSINTLFYIVCIY